MNQQFLGRLLGKKKDIQMRTGLAVKIEAVAVIVEQYYMTTLFMTESCLEAGVWVENGKS